MVAAKVAVIDGSADTTVVMVGWKLSEDVTSGTPACVLEATAAVFWMRADAVGVRLLTMMETEMAMREGDLWKDRRVYWKNPNSTQKSRKEVQCWVVIT